MKRILILLLTIISFGAQAQKVNMVNQGSASQGINNNSFSHLAGGLSIPKFSSTPSKYGVLSNGDTVLINVWIDSATGDFMTRLKDGSPTRLVNYDSLIGGFYSKTQSDSISAYIYLRSIGYTDSVTVGIASGFKGSVTPSDSPTVNGIYTPSVSGTYTKMGGYVVSLDSGFVYITKIGSTYTKTVIPLNLTTYAKNGGDTTTMLRMVQKVDGYPYKIIEPNISALTTGSLTSTRTYIFNIPIPVNKTIRELHVKGTTAGPISIGEYSISGGNATLVARDTYIISVGENIITDFHCSPGNYIGILTSNTAYYGRIAISNTTSSYGVYNFNATVTSATALPAESFATKYGIQAYLSDSTAIVPRLDALTGDIEGLGDNIEEINDNLYGYPNLALESNISACTTTPGTSQATWLFNYPIPSDQRLKEIHINCFAGGAIFLAEYSISGGVATYIQGVSVTVSTGLNIITTFTCAPGHYIGVSQSGITYNGRMGINNSTSAYGIYTFNTILTTSASLPTQSFAVRRGIQLYMEDINAVVPKLESLSETVSELVETNTNTTLELNSASLNYKPDTATSFSRFTRGTIVDATGVRTPSSSTDTLNRISEYCAIKNKRYLYFDGFPTGWKVYYYDSAFLPMIPSSGFINKQPTTVPDGAAYFCIAINTVAANGQTNYDSLYYGFKDCPIYLDAYDGSIVEQRTEDLQNTKQYIASFVLSPNSFTGNQRQRIQKCLDFCKDNGGIVEVGYDSLNSTSLWVIDSALIIGSNTTLKIKANTTIEKANGSYDNMIRNAGMVFESSVITDPATSVVRNYNIKIIGEDKKTSILRGPAIPYSAPRPYSGDTAVVPWVGDNYGWRTQFLSLCDIAGLEVSNLTFTRTTGWGCYVSVCKDVNIHDIIVNSFTVPNGDGIDITSWCENVKVENISGLTKDDMVFVGCISRANLTYPNGNYLFQLNPEDVLLKSMTQRPVTKNVLVNNISGSSNTHLVTVYTTMRGKVENVTINNIHQTSTSKTPVRVVRLSSGYGTVPAQPGDMVNIKVNDVVSLSSPVGVEVNLPLRNSWINNITKATGQTAVEFEVAFPQDPSVKVTNAP